MINELYQLSQAMKQAGIYAQNWHRKYKPIPNVRPTAPCFRLIIEAGSLVSIDSVSHDQAAVLRKYGTNHGSFPCMNLVPLYRITDKRIIKLLSALKPDLIDEQILEQINLWCSTSNWTTKFRKKYNISLKSVPQEMQRMLQKAPCKPISVLLQEAAPFADPDYLFKELHRVSFDMLRRKENIDIAKQVLFHFGNQMKAADDDTGVLSIALDSTALLNMGIPAVSNRFVLECNQFLMDADPEESDISKLTETDAFGILFAPIEEPMPSVKLAGGFDATLRTMFKDQHCQYRYGAIENASYPISPSMRMELQAALGWLSSIEHKGIYWANTDKNEILFAYPHTLPKSPISFVNPFKRNNEKIFQIAAKEFLASALTLRGTVAESLAEHIQIFILRKISRGQTKVVFTYITTPRELQQRSREWIAGCLENIPPFHFKQFNVPYPLDVADILNRAWKQDGSIASDSFRPFPKYRGMELFLDRSAPFQSDLHMLVQSCGNIAMYFGSPPREDHAMIIGKVKQQIAILGFLLYRMNIRKEQYMNSFPFQYGQLLKAADELHRLYCQVVRNGDMPSQLAGSSLYQAAVESPVRTLDLLQRRISPYYVWAKTYCMKNEEKSGLAGWLCRVTEMIADQLSSVWNSDTRLNDEEKAQMFLGYLGSLPKSHNNTMDDKEAPEASAKD